MELKEFIKAAVRDITDAVSELQKELDNGTVVNPNYTKSAYLGRSWEVMCHPPRKTRLISLFRFRWFFHVAELKPRVRS